MGHIVPVCDAKFQQPIANADMDVNCVQAISIAPCKLFIDVKVYQKVLHMQVDIDADKDKFDIPAERTHHIVSPLKTDNQYEFWVTAVTTVGEGSESRHIVQAPTDNAPAKIASFGKFITTALHETLRLSCRAVGQPDPHQYWRKNGNPIEEDSRTQIIDAWLLQISPVQSTDAGNYSCSAENIYGKDKITYYVAVQVPLAPTNLHASSATVSSITLNWLLSSDTDHKIQGNYLYYKREFGEWERIKLKAEETGFTLNHLQCGTKYYFYLEAFSQLRHSEPTSTITAFTQGSAPFAPSISDLIQVNSSFILLNLTSWDDGDCPITSIVIEYRQKNDNSWTLVSNNIKKEQSEFLILDLNPGTWYTLRVTAHNSAGSTVEHYNFVTLTHFGATVAPELRTPPGSGRKPFYNDAGTVAAIIIGLTLAVIAAAVLFFCLRRHNMISCNKYREKPQDTGQLAIADKRVAQNTYVNSDSGKDSSNIPEPTYLPNPMCMTLGHRQNISPYATFQVPVSGGPNCSDGEVESETQDISHKQHISKCGSSTESTYSRIHKGFQHGNETPEWIPLHNLYQAHRY
ncbi:Down syndrome cell adhesion molecule-like protein Dscam2 [Schistocerca americana]|uniref:Down syndrome cell adhesion molecule-like protein Dscam2 n=1 Tax=Schistocerca americana TaxID=7009 RepID=UPI001F4F3A8D|nr:Down syndrome cell adhesion molecule-like protein Dscam2 [Schistocerca americana]